jgi:hypothetical protein
MKKKDFFHKKRKRRKDYEEKFGIVFDGDYYGCQFIGVYGRFKR